jgi:ABC-type multidrug transport system fused ATPase/permease subunit
MNGGNPNDLFTGGPRRGSPWSSSRPRARSFDNRLDDASFGALAEEAWRAPAEEKAPEGTLGTAVIAGLVLVVIVALSFWRLLGGPVDPVGALGWVLLPLIGALLVTIGAAIDEERRRPLARAAGALFLLSLLLLLRRVDLFASVLGLLTFFSVLALSVALRPFANRLRRESGLPDLGAGWWIWSVVAAYAWTSLDLFATVKVALVGYLLEWAGPALDRQTAATRERLLGLFRPRQVEPVPLPVDLSEYPWAPPGANTREEREIAKAIVDFVQLNFALKYNWASIEVSKVMSEGPKATAYILLVPGNVPADLLLGRATDLATFLTTSRPSDGMPRIRTKGFRELDVAIKSASELGGVRIEIQKSSVDQQTAWFAPFYGRHWAGAIGAPQQKTPDRPQYLTILGMDLEGNPVVAKIADKNNAHLLVAGMSGSGKSYLMHLIIIQLLMQYGPDQLQLAVIDPKRGVGMRYRRVPHLLAPVATGDPKDWISLMKKVHDVVDARYTLFEAAGESELSNYNSPNELKLLEKRVADARRQGNTQAAAEAQARIEEIKARRLPVILLVIDEVTDITSSTDKSVVKAYQDYVGKIARVGRGAGVFLIIGVQRPTQQNVGEIRSSMNQRIVLRVQQASESEMMLGKTGNGGDLATRLSGGGDGLYYADGELVRFQALMIPDGPADLHGAGENHRTVAEYVKAITAQWGGENSFDTAAPAPSVGATKSALLSAAHGPQCDDREWLIIRALELAIAEHTDIYKMKALSPAEIAVWARKAAEEYQYLGPAMSDGEIERALKRFHPNDPGILSGGVYPASRASVGPYILPGQTTDITLHGKFSAAPPTATAAPAARDAASVIEEIRSRPSRDQ